MPPLPFSPEKFSALIDRDFADDNRASVPMSHIKPSNPLIVHSPFVESIKKEIIRHREVFISISL
jgi:hypothetical protein